MVVWAGADAEVGFIASLVCYCPIGRYEALIWALFIIRNRDSYLYDVDRSRVRAGFANFGGKSLDSG